MGAGVRLGAICGAGSATGGAMRGCACWPGALIITAPAQSALSPAMPSFASMTASTNFFAPVRSTDTSFGVSPRFMTSDSNTFFPSTQTPKTTLPAGGGGGGGAPGCAAGAADPSSTPIIDMKRVAAPPRSIVMSASARSGTACGYVTPPSLNTIGAGGVVWPRCGRGCGLSCTLLRSSLSIQVPFGGGSVPCSALASCAPRRRALIPATSVAMAIAAPARRVRVLFIRAF